MLLLLVITVFILNACSSQRDDEVAKKLLEEKYNEEFEILAIGKRYDVLENDTFEVTAAPLYDPSLKFLAKIGKNGTWIIDEYIQVLAEKEISDRVETVAKNLYQNYAIKVYVGWGESSITNKKDFSLERYKEEIPGYPIVIDIVVNEYLSPNINVEKEYEAFSNLFSTELPYDMGLDIFYTTNENVEKSKTKFKEFAETYQDFYDLMEGSKKRGTGIDEGKMMVPFEAFKNQSVFNGMG